MKAKDFLKQLERIDIVIENKLIEREQWRSIALGTTSSSGTDIIVNGAVCRMDKVQSSGNPQKMADAVAKYVDLEAEIDAAIDKLIEAKKDIISVIESLAQWEYDLLHKVYVQRLSLYDAAEKSNRSHSWAKTIHGIALKNVQRILDERENNER